VIPIVRTAEEDEDASDRVRRAAVRAGSLSDMLPFKAPGCCRDVCGFQYAGDMPHRLDWRHELQRTSLRQPLPRQLEKASAVRLHGQQQPLVLLGEDAGRTEDYPCRHPGRVTEGWRGG
jgi:hypothetical protein